MRKLQFARHPWQTGCQRLYGWRCTARNRAARDGVSQIYGAGATLNTSAHRVPQAEDLLQREQITVTRAKHLTWPSLFAQSDVICDEWINEGFLSFGRETSTVAAVADYFGVKWVSLLSAWDALPHGKAFLHPLNKEDADRL